jgi:serine/threonine protein kinase
VIGTTIGHYKILEKLGGGGMGVVYKAQDLKLDRFVALKFLPPELTRNPEAKDRFIHEAKAASALDHSNVCTIHEIGETDEGNLYIAMACYDGETLKSRIEHGPLQIVDAIEIAIQAAQGLSEAHARDIVHRDIKPANILVTKNDVVKIVDFGLAKLGGRTVITKIGSTLGTVAYMSPEQARGDNVDHRTDIWSLGVVLYEMVTGQHPFPGDYEQAVIYRILNESPQPMKDFRPGVPAKLERIVSQCMEKEDFKRYHDMGEVIRDLQALKKDVESGTVDERESSSGEGRWQMVKTSKEVESERRQVSILIAGVIGSDVLYERLDAEVASTVLDDCFKGLGSIVSKYEGLVEKYVGEGVMATFGAPVAHENDPERSVRCALEMRSFVERLNTISTVQLPVKLELHIGVHSGVVIAGSVGGQMSKGYSVIGDAVNVAAGLMQVAPPGEIYLSAETHRLVSSLVDVDGPHRVDVKGKAQPAEVFGVRSLRSNLGPGRGALGKGEFVGREQELVTITGALDRVLKKKETRMFVCGEAGVGKTRLKDELLKVAHSKGISAFEGKCSSFEMNTPYYLWNTLLKSMLRIGMEMPEAETRTRLHETLQLLSLGGEEPYLATFLSLRYEEILLEVDQDRKRRIFEAARKFLAAYATRQPVVFVLEDLHWIDRFSQELLEFMFGTEIVAPAFFFSLYRAEYPHEQRIARWGERVDLNRLPAEKAKELVRSRLGASTVPQALEDLILKRAEGNPFFTEEMIKTLIDRKVIAVKKGTVEILSSDLEAGVPETVQGVIMARIDRLEERMREVLLDASVIGREFSRPVLEFVLEKRKGVEADLHQLQMMELILEKEEARELEYLFKHYLIQEVAYNTLLAKKRKKLHGLIAKAIETLYADRLKEFFELLAFHFEKAEEWEKAAEYLGRAGRKAGEIFTKEETNLFEARRDEAIKKIYESRSAKRIGWKALGFATGVVVVPLVLALLAFTIMAAVVLWNLVSSSIAYLDFDLTLANGQFVFPLLILFVMTFCLLWGSLLFSFFGIMPFFRRTAKIYDLSEESIQVSFRGNKKFVIRFTEVEEILFREYKSKKKRRLRFRLLDPFSRVRDYSKMTVWKLLKRSSLHVPGYSFGFSSVSGEIQIIRKKGLSGLQFAFPFLYSAKFSRIFVLSPSDPKEFHEQLETAYAKWQKRSH